ncbi:hypothetical protein CBS101457_002737 [Exobasidium rhododendri]|nr:hypothetical protein CBS101457_002737 [Exobasidium rhododendri]
MTSSSGHYNDMSMHSDQRYQQSPIPGEAAHRLIAIPPASRESSVSLAGPGAGSMNSPGPSQWRSTPLRMANMFEDSSAAYGAEDAGYGSAAINDSTPPSEDNDSSFAAISDPSQSIPSKAATTRVAKACVPCSTKKRRCDGGKPECKVCVVLGTPCSYESKGLKRGPPKGFRSGPKESAKARLLRSLETTIRDLSLQMGGDDTGKEIMRISRDRGISLTASASVADVGESSPSKKIKRDDSVSHAKEEQEGGGEEEDFLGVNEQGSIRHFGSSSGIQLLHTQTPTTNSLRPSSNLREQRMHLSSNGDPSTYHLPTVPNRLHAMGSNTSHSETSILSPQQQQQQRFIGTKSQGQVSLELNRRLFHHYWEGFHPFWPVLYKPAFDKLPLDQLPLLLDAALSNAIYAIAVCVASPSLDAEVETELGDAPAGEVLFLRAESHLFGGRSTPTPSLSSIQVCFYLALYCQGSGQLSKAYIYSSLANSMSFDLGLHRHLHHYDNNPVEKESRIRLIHCVYILSTILSAEMGRPPMMRSKDIDVPLLSEQEEDEFETDQMGNQLYTASCLNGGVRLFSIVETVLSQIHSFRRKAALRRMGSDNTKSVVEDISRRLETWRKTLPDPLKMAGDRKKDSRLLPNFIALHLWHHTAVLLLHRPFVPHDEGSSLTEVLNNPFHIKCTKASNELFDLLLQLSNANNVDRLSTDLAYCIFTAAVMFVFNARLGQSATVSDGQGSSNSSNARVLELSNEAKRQFLMCKEWLRSLSARWPAASAHKQLLDGFSTVGDDVLAGGGPLEVDRTGRAEGGIKTEWPQQNTSASSWGASNDRGLSANRRGALDASHEQVSLTPTLDANVSFDTPPSRYSSSTGTYSDGGLGQIHYQEGSQYMYYPTSSNNNIPNARAATQQYSNSHFPPNIFDMESVYWNETAARNPASFEASQGLNNIIQRLPFSSASHASVLAPTPAVKLDQQQQQQHQLQQPPQLSSLHTTQQSTDTGHNGLQMLAQATTAGMGQVSPFTFQQEPSQPEWSDVINMLQLPPAFLQ